jgi:hypothetical protein
MANLKSQISNEAMANLKSQISNHKWKIEIAALLSEHFYK